MATLSDAIATFQLTCPYLQNYIFFGHHIMFIDQNIKGNKMKGFEKSETHLSIESTFRSFFERSDDSAYKLPHSYEYYERQIRQAVEMYPASLTLQQCASAIGEEAFFDEDVDIVFHHHLSWFPPIWHTAQFFVVQIVLNGSFTSYIANQELHLTKGNVCIVAPDSRHALGCFSNAAVFCVLIRRNVFEKSFLRILQHSNSLLADFFTRTLYSNNPHPFLYFNSAWDSELMKILLAAYRESLGHRSFRHMMINSIMDNFFIVLLRNHEKDLVFPNHTRVNQSENLIFMLKYMQEHYTTLSLPELAALFNYSERQVQRILLKNTGQTYTQLIQTMKMKEAARLLRDSRYPISKIASDLGYSNLGNFRRIFRKAYDMSPAAYRRDFS